MFGINLNLSFNPSDKTTLKSVYSYTASNTNSEYEDILDGISKHWSIDGILISESEYSNGMPHGRWKKYYKNQAILYEVNYFHGKKQGDEKWYYENGKIKSEQTFHHGVPNSVLIRWHPDGTIVY